MYETTCGNSLEKGGGMNKIVENELSKITHNFLVQIENDEGLSNGMSHIVTSLLMRVLLYY